MAKVDYKSWGMIGQKRSKVVAGRVIRSFPKVGGGEMIREAFFATFLIHVIYCNTYLITHFKPLFEVKFEVNICDQKFFPSGR